MAKRRARVGTQVRTNVQRQTAELPLFASAMQQQAPAEDLEQLADRPEFLCSGLPSLNRALRGGFPVGGATLVAGRPRVGVTSLFAGATLAALDRGERAAYFSDRLREDQLRGRLVVLEARVNGYRFRAGFATAEDRLALTAARQNITWGSLSLISKNHLTLAHIDSHLFSYRPLLVLADIQPREGNSGGRLTLEEQLSGLEHLASLARKHRVALLVHLTLPRGHHRPDVLELPGLGTAAKLFDAVVLLHRDTGADDNPSDSDDLTSTDQGTPSDAEACVVRVAGREVEPRTVALRFDQRFAGLLEP